MPGIGLVAATVCAEVPTSASTCRAHRWGGRARTGDGAATGDKRHQVIAHLQHHEPLQDPSPFLVYVDHRLTTHPAGDRHYRMGRCCPVESLIVPIIPKLLAARLVSHPVVRATLLAAWIGYVADADRSSRNHVHPSSPPHRCTSSEPRRWRTHPRRCWAFQRSSCRIQDDQVPLTRHHVSGLLVLQVSLFDARWEGRTRDCASQEGACRTAREAVPGWGQVARPALSERMSLGNVAHMRQSAERNCLRRWGGVPPFGGSPVRGGPPPPKGTIDVRSVVSPRPLRWRARSRHGRAPSGSPAEFRCTRPSGEAVRVGAVVRTDF